MPFLDIMEFASSIILEISGDSSSITVLKKLGEKISSEASKQTILISNERLNLQEFMITEIRSGYELRTIEFFPNSEDKPRYEISGGVLPNNIIPFYILDQRI
jgi:hypothetical protein